MPKHRQTREDPDRLTPKQEIFVREYLVDLNATQAAIRAGYSEKNADKIGSELLGKTRVKAAVDAAISARSKKTEITAEWVLFSLKEVVERCLTRKPVMEFDYETKTMMQKRDKETGLGVWEFDAAGANRALELLGRHLKLFTDKHEIKIDSGIGERLAKAIKRVEGKK